MLTELRIRNFTIIDTLSISFLSGLTILTGETGAGKSIIVGALGLLLGDRASAEVIKTGEKEAHVEAYFDPINHPLLDELGIESGDGMIFRRSISLQGKTKAYINDTSVNLSTLSVIGKSLIDIYGQHEHQGLLRKENHLLFLDTLGGLFEEAHIMTSSYNDVITLRNTVSEMRSRMQERSLRIEFLRFQLHEIDAAKLVPGEKETIEQERKILLNLSKLKETADMAYNLLYRADSSCLEQLSMVVARIKEMAHIDSDAQDPLATLESAVPLIEDALIAIRNIRDKYDSDPQHLSELDERLEGIKRLERKYGEGVDGIMLYKERAQEELEKLEHIKEKLDVLESNLTKKNDTLTALSDRLSKKRHMIAARLEQLISSELRELGFQRAQFKIDMKQRETLTEHGKDDIEFMFSGNPGEAPKPLIKIASGGELSRIMLALKCVELSRLTSHQVPPLPLPSSAEQTLIFDEVDAGIGGVTAQHVGNKLKAIASNCQVICITHLPQIAAKASHHIRVTKDIFRDNVRVAIDLLTGTKRKEELARMLSGMVTDGALKHAGELLSINRNK
ncbi:MAG: DNA repair protein RecN [Dissulfurispiraceae bacterium]